MQLFTIDDGQDGVRLRTVRRRHLGVGRYQPTAQRARRRLPIPDSGLPRWFADGGIVKQAAGRSFGDESHELERPAKQTVGIMCGLLLLLFLPT